jgi:hypothetical protein
LIQGERERKRYDDIRTRGNWTHTIEQEAKRRERASERDMYLSLNIKRGTYENIKRGTYENISACVTWPHIAVQAALFEVR